MHPKLPPIEDIRARVPGHVGRSLKAALVRRRISIKDWVEAAAVAWLDKNEPDWRLRQPNQRR